MVDLRRVFLFVFALVPLLIQPFARAALPALQEPTPTVAHPVATAVPATAVPQAAVLSPQPGQALQGSVPVEIGIAGPGYQSVEVAFAYANNPTGVWFPIYQGNLPDDPAADPAALQAPITEWDTSAISDGAYTLRVVLTLADGSRQTYDVGGLRVRNYTPIETDTPAPVPTTALPPTPDQAATQTASALASATPLPPPGATPDSAATASAAIAAATATAIAAATPTPLPPAPAQALVNPLELQPATVLDSLGRGALAAVGLFALGGLYATARRKRQKDNE